MFARCVSRRSVIKAAAWGWIALTPWGRGLFAGNELDVTQRPAPRTKRVKGVPLLALTRAGKRVFAAGVHGIILFSDDNGISWHQANVPVSVSLTNLYFITPQIGWAVGHAGVVLRTTDSGASWSKQLTAAELQHDSPNHVLFDAYFFDEHNGFVVGSHGLFLATKDGGNTWLPWQDRIENSQELHLYCIRATDNTLYIAGEQGCLFRSNDSGKIFSRIRAPYAGSYFGILADSTNLVIFGMRGHAYHSNDAGKHWKRIEITSPAALSAGATLTDGSIVLGSQAGTVLRSTDHGMSFQPLPLQTFPVTGIVQADEDSLILSGMKGIVSVPVSTDANGARL